MEIALLGQVRGCDVLIFNSNLYEYTIFSFFFFPFLDYMPLFHGDHFLYSPSPLHPSLPLVDLVENPLDACPIRTSWKFCW